MHALTLSSGHSLHYRDDGPRDGLTLVFSNSLGTDFRVWDPLLPHLPGGLRIVRYDKAGHGLSDFAGDRRIEDHAADLAELLAHLEIANAVVIGLSVGGLIAQGLYHSVPERVAGLVFCDTADLIGSPEMWNDRIGQIEAKGIAAMADPILERWFTAPFRTGDASFPAWRNMLVRTPVEGYCAVARTIRDADFTKATPSIKVPTLCVVGTEDGSTPPELVRAFAERIPGAGFAEIPQCGHIPCVEQPEALALHLKKFLADF